jgi:hypothetical protein
MQIVCSLSETVCRLFFLLQTECRLCFLSSSDGRDDVSKPVATVDSSSDVWMTSPHLSLLGATVTMDRRGMPLLSYHCSNALVAIG